MLLSEINPFLRYAELQASLLSSAPFSASYDYRLFYVVGGTTHLVLKERTVEVSGGTLIFLRPATPYYFVEKVKTIVLNFDLTRASSGNKKPLPPVRERFFKRELVKEDAPPSELCSPIILDSAFAFEKELYECILHYNFPSALSDALTSAILKNLLCRAVALSEEKVNSSSELTKSITLYIKSNYDKPICANDIAQAFGYHPYHLNKIFKEKTGTTMHQTLIRERIKVAKRLLATTTLSIEQIAFESGFGDRSQFCTSFKKATDKTPLQYKKEKQKTD